MSNYCNMCYDDEKETTFVAEYVNGIEMLLLLCDDCLVEYAKKTEIKLDGHIHGYHIDDYDQFSEREQSVIDSVLESIGLTRENWGDWGMSFLRHSPESNGG